MKYEERPPTLDEVRQALESFVAAVREHYGSRLRGIVLFGSRARGDQKPDSDADVAVIIEDGAWEFWQEKMKLADLAYEPLVELGLRIQPWPISASSWQNPSVHHNPKFVEAIRRDARSLSEAA
jgi:uncharacterized protein